MWLILIAEFLCIEQLIRIIFLYCMKLSSEYFKIVNNLNWIIYIYFQSHATIKDLVHYFVLVILPRPSCCYPKIDVYSFLFVWKSCKINISMFFLAEWTNITVIGLFSLLINIVFNNLLIVKIVMFTIIFYNVYSFLYIHLAILWLSWFIPYNGKLFNALN